MGFIIIIILRHPRFPRIIPGYISICIAIRLYLPNLFANLLLFSVMVCRDSFNSADFTQSSINLGCSSYFNSNWNPLQLEKSYPHSSKKIYTTFYLNCKKDNTCRYNHICVNDCNACHYPRPPPYPYPKGPSSRYGCKSCIEGDCFKNSDKSCMPLDSMSYCKSCINSSDEWSPNCADNSTDICCKECDAMVDENLICPAKKGDIVTACNIQENCVSPQAADNSPASPSSAIPSGCASNGACRKCDTGYNVSPSTGNCTANTCQCDHGKPCRTNTDENALRVSLPRV